MAVELAAVARHDRRVAKAEVPNLTQTERLLAEKFGGVVPLAEVCQTHFGCGYVVARQKAAMNQLPIPVFQLSESRKAPWVIRATDLAQWIDARGDEALQQWQKSQVWEGAPHTRPGWRSGVKR